MSVIRDLEPGHDPCNFEMIAKSQINTECGGGGRELSNTPVPFEATMHKLFEQPFKMVRGLQQQL